MSRRLPVGRTGALSAEARRADPGGGRGRRAPSCSARASGAPTQRATPSPASWPRRLESPLVLDADGLNAHAGRLERLAGREQRRRCSRRTPASSAACSSATSDEVGAHRLACAPRGRSARPGAIVVLKGDDTIVVDGREPSRSSPSTRSRAPALATAGTGDVLAGTIGALSPAGMDAVRGRLRRGSRQHRAPGVIAADRLGAAESVIAGDVIDGAARGAALRAVRRARAEIDLGAVERNCMRLRATLTGRSRALRRRQGRRLRPRRRSGARAPPCGAARSGSPSRRRRRRRSFAQRACPTPRS